MSETLIKADPGWVAHVKLESGVIEAFPIIFWRHIQHDDPNNELCTRTDIDPVIYGLHLISNGQLPELGCVHDWYRRSPETVIYNPTLYAQTLATRSQETAYLLTCEEVVES